MSKYDYIDRDTDDLLSDIPTDIIVGFIKDQLDSPQSTINYLNTPLEKIEYLKSNVKDQDEREKLDNLQSDLAESILDIIKEVYDVNLDSDSYEPEAYLEAVEAIYNFFIVEFEENLQRFFYNYIKRYKSVLAEPYSDKEKKDVTTVSSKKKVKDKDLSTILINLPDIIQDIILLDMDEAEFIELATEEGSFDGNLLSELVESGSLFGEFADDMLNRLNDDFIYLKDNMILHIQTKLTSKIK